MMTKWIVVDRPGYAGTKRDELHRLRDQLYGRDNWKTAWQWGRRIIPKKDAIRLYEDAYYIFLKNNKDVLNWLLSTASDVYDNDPSNVGSGFDYSIQETPGTHLQDIAIRRAVKRLGKKFRGNHLMQVRDGKSEGFRLNPGIVPFHKPHMILNVKIKNYGGEEMWWEPGSIEDFYQKNKLLLVKR